MGFEHLLAALGASWYVSSQEKKVQKQMDREADLRYRLQMNRLETLSQWLSTKGFNRVRQNELTRMMNSTLLSDKKEFAKILGRPCSANSASIANAVRFIAEKEGWIYYSEDDLFYDPEYRRISGWNRLSDEDVANHQKLVEERRYKEAIWQSWAQKYPRCMEANVSPEFCESEEQFALIVDYEFYQWRKGCHNFYAIEPGNYETKEEYESALAERIKELEDYEESFKRLGVTDTGIGRFSLCNKLNLMKQEWNDRPQNIPLEYYFYISYLNHCVPKIIKTVSSWEREYFEVLLITAKHNGIDLNEVIDKAEAGTLFPDGTRQLRNYYLSDYFMAKTGELYTHYSSEYYRRKYGFTLEDFAKHGGKDPDYHFSPPLSRK